MTTDPFSFTFHCETCKREVTATMQLRTFDKETDDMKVTSWCPRCRNEHEQRHPAKKSEGSVV
jgi:hypothetical protein